MRIIISPAKKMNIDTDSFAPEALLSFYRRQNSSKQRCKECPHRAVTGSVEV